jgi:hypothetical protein
MESNINNHSTPLLSTRQAYERRDSVSSRVAHDVAAREEGVEPHKQYVLL